MNETLHQSNTPNTNGQKKCPYCGGTDIIFHKKTCKYICFHCKKEIEGETSDKSNLDIHKINERIISPGAANITECDSLITVKCSSCGSKITIDSEHLQHTKCHWCRNTLVLNEHLSNGTIPDIIIPFSINKDTAYKNMVDFLHGRKNFAKKRFKKHFKKENIIGVYFPYMVIDIKSHVMYKGEGESATVRYNKSKLNGAFDAKLYTVERECDVIIKNFIIESSLSKLYNHHNDTTNIINTILPYDMTKAVKWDARYIQEHNIEKRDGNILDIRPTVYSHVKKIIKHNSINWIKKYTSGVRWDSEKVDMRGELWQAAYLPVWLYTYTDIKDGQEILHYIAVNGQTGETMGSIPFCKKTARIAHTFQFLIVLAITIIFPQTIAFTWMFFCAFLLCFPNAEDKYRNSYEKHNYIGETPIEVTNMNGLDIYQKDLIGIDNSNIIGANHKYTDID